MANETSLEYKKREFWFMENNLLLLIFFLYDAAEEKGIHTFSNHLRDEYIIDIKLLRSGAYYGLVNLIIDRIATHDNETIKNEFIGVLEDAKQRINNKYPDMIPEAELQRFVDFQDMPDNEKERWKFPVHKSSILNLIDLILLLLDETKEFPHQGKFIRFKGWPSWNGEIVI